MKKVLQVLLTSANCLIMTIILIIVTLGTLYWLRVTHP